PGNCSGMEEATGAPSSFAVWDPKRLRASGRDGETVMTDPPSPLTMLLSRHTKRREFIRLLGGALAAQAIPANAQELRVRTVGVLMGFANDAEAKARVEAFEKGLEIEGWSLGQNLRIEYRYAEGDSVRMKALAKELVELKPDCILGHSTPVVTALMQA